jgi:hypothetical protein
VQVALFSVAPPLFVQVAFALHLAACVVCALARSASQNSSSAHNTTVVVGAVISQLQRASVASVPSRFVQTVALSHLAAFQSSTLVDVESTESSHQLSASQMTSVAVPSISGEPHLQLSSFLATPSCAAQAVISSPVFEHVPVVPLAQLWLALQMLLVAGVPEPTQLHLNVFVPFSHAASAAHLTPGLLSLVVLWQNCVSEQVVPPQSHSAVFWVTPVKSAHGAGVVQRVSEERVFLQ